jgi:hypothetical protein
MSKNIGFSPLFLAVSARRRKSMFAAISETQAHLAKM